MKDLQFINLRVLWFSFALLQAIMYFINGGDHLLLVVIGYTIVAYLGYLTYHTQWSKPHNEEPKHVLKTMAEAFVGIGVAQAAIRVINNPNITDQIGAVNRHRLPIMWLLLLFLVPVCEELVFRAHAKTPTAKFVSVIFFGLMHCFFGFAPFLIYVVFGTAMQYITDKTHVKYAILFRIIWNFVHMIM